MKKRTQLRKRLPLNDFVQADRGQPAQCSQKHRSEYARRQTALAADAVRHRLTAETVIDAREGRRRLPSVRSSDHLLYDAALFRLTHASWSTLVEVVRPGIGHLA